MPPPHQTRPGLPSPAGAAEGKDELARARVRPRWLVLRGGDVPTSHPQPKAGGERRWAAEHPHVSHAGLRGCSSAAGHGDVFGVSFPKHNYFAAPPSPDAFRGLHSSPALPGAHHSTILPFFHPLRAKPSGTPMVSAPEPPWPVKSRAQRRAGRPR